MKREEAMIFIAQSIKFGVDAEKVAEAIKALEHEPCKDCISRKQVISGIDRYIDKAQSTGTIDDFISFRELVVKQLPPATPMYKKGKWIDCGVSARCSICGCKDHEYSKHHYCPNCGAKMEGGE